MKVYRYAHKTNTSGFTHSVAWRDPELGKRRQQKFADESAAIEAARLKAGQLNAGRIASASMTLQDRDELQAARLLAGGIPLLSALREWKQANNLTDGQVLVSAERFAQRNRGGINRTSLNTASAQFQKEKTRLGRTSAKSHMRTIKPLLDTLGANSIDSISEAQLTTYLNGIADPSSRNTHRKRMVTLWRWARKKKMLPQDTVTEAERTERAEEHSEEIGIISPTTLKRLLAFTLEDEPEYIPALTIACMCGLRASEVHSQRWEDIDLSRRHVRVTKAKRNTPSKRLVDICPAAIKWLKMTKVRKGPICPNRYTQDDIRKRAIGAGIELPPNCFRHSYISHRVMLTGDVAGTSLQAGNSPKEIHKSYRELVTKAEAKEWFQITTAASVAHRTASDAQS